MKKFNLLLSAVALFVAGNSFVDAQNSKNPWAITVGAHAVDHNSATGPFNQYFKTDNWDIVPPLSKLSIIRNLNRSFDVDLTASVGEVDNNRLRVKDELFINAGLGLRYKLANGYILKEDSWFDPYLRVGAGYHRYDYTGLEFPLKSYYGNGNGEEFTMLTEAEDLEKNHFAASLGAGINFWFTKNFGLNVASDYNWLPAYGGNNYFDFFQHTVGVTFRFGKQDRDNDGIPDDEDACPDTPGIATGDPATNGCPDTDGDGIFDKDDACPNEYGLAEFQGCPDTDGDGVPDKDDACPEVAGPVENNGCPWPDTDGDGILDKDDACPNEYGLAEFQGCPDTDGDGIPDKDDACPTEKGPKENNGCPWTEVHVAKRLSNILFEYNSDKIVPSSYDDVRVAAQILNSDDLKAKSFYLDGHADQRGSAAYNKTLSLKRAKALVKILSERGGVDANRLTARGLGESQLLCTEETEECYQRNRRVEVLPKNATVTETKVVKPATKKKK
ncbi:OmpA family protein [Empedobacter sp. 225-1]|uniref:OmpA family protein n=1 Tax=unclassified Empedobacter TaxID=2643773 RepID=UPI0025758C53|nr:MULTISPECIES: OmpA family protein [unclassified Empedobacter]MDM1523447.1 OmpA family protein [Empedobacter sp. 225-1]MDM1543437.1 OmpA family protein [Empedobacter sp. 189-2]